MNSALAEPPPALRFPMLPSIDEPRILIFAPTGRDASLTANFLRRLGSSIHICDDMLQVCEQAGKGCDLILLAEETLNENSVKLLVQTLLEQEPWSDIPITIITSGGEASAERLRILASIGPRGNVGLLERPFRRGTLLSTVDVALRSRARQQQVRQLLKERAEAQAMLQRLVRERTAELTETNSQLETLVYSIAHDLRAPLRSMQAFAKILLEDYSPKLDATAQHYAQRIVHSAETMDALVLDLLAYGKAARAEVPLEPVNLKDVWESAMAQFERDISERDAVVRTVQPLPWVQAHPSTLTQILANLLGNALKFVGPGVRPVVVFQAVVHGDRVRITVEDNGIGIAPEYHDKIFRVFERLHVGKGDGTGIGLAIVRKGVERMGGSVGVESAPPRAGSIFWIELKKAPQSS
jgi:signal transduction histidine kinase